MLGHDAQQAQEALALLQAQRCQALLVDLFGDGVALFGQFAAGGGEVQRMAPAVGWVASTFDRAQGLKVVDDSNEQAAVNS